MHYAMHTYRKGGERESYDELSLLHVSGEIGDLFAEVGEVVESGVEQGEPISYCQGAFLEGGTEGMAVDEHEDLAALDVDRHRFEGHGEIGCHALDGGDSSGWEGIRRGERAEELVEKELESVREGGEAAWVLEREAPPLVVGVVRDDAEVGE